MNDNKRTALWNAFYDSEVRSRYFMLLTAKKRQIVTLLTISIGVLSCGPLTSFLWAAERGDSIGGVLGLLAGLIGIYVATSGITKDLATATMAASSWTRHAGDLSHFWIRCESGDDVWSELSLTERDIRSVDAAVIDQLSTNDKLLAIAETQTEAAMVR